MFLLLTVVAFAWMMAINVYILLYQQRNMSLLGHLRSFYPDLYQKLKTRLMLGMIANEGWVRRSLSPAGGILDDQAIEDALKDLAEIRRRGFWMLVPLTGLLVVVGILAIW